ncbi:hypothetical protein EUC41_31070 [Achromobacter denitrificans]|uniref:hypothetical protein n=1 Tax=Achromobacter denitrificans TaxID=32002 RepID=UPI00240D8B5A|nr:hypothetical protein [Achromobacter denitrificans]MDX3878151.1 hypothetical protein [Achromobacter sp.]WFC70358.1 hypothetical protein EUC41_31070 [Achromobacter denitrificans]
MKTPTFIIRTNGRDQAFCIGAAPANPDAADALAVNPLASPETVLSAAADRIKRIHVLSRPFNFVPDHASEEIPTDALTDFVAALGALAEEAAQLLGHATTLRHLAKRGEA